MIDSLLDGVGIVVERATFDRAAAHRDDIAGLGHLVVEAAKAGSHFLGNGAGCDNQVGLARRGAENHTEAIEIIARRTGGHQFDGAAGGTKQEVPE